MLRLGNQVLEAHVTRLAVPIGFDDQSVAPTIILPGPGLVCVCVWVCAGEHSGGSGGACVRRAMPNQAVQDPPGPGPGGSYRPALPARRHGHAPRGPERHQRGTPGGMEPVDQNGGAGVGTIRSRSGLRASHAKSVSKKNDAIGCAECILILQGGRIFVGFAVTPLNKRICPMRQSSLL